MYKVDGCIAITANSGGVEGREAFKREEEAEGEF